LSALLTLQQEWLLDIARDYADLNKRFGEVIHDATEQGANGAGEVVAEAARTSKRDADRAAA
jgi:hypothetical protein